MPSWLSNKSLTITKTQNGWAVGPDAGTPVGQVAVFETWDALVYWLNANWANPA